MAKITTDMLMYMWAIKRGLTEHDPASTIHEVGDKVNEAFQTDGNAYAYRRKFKDWIDKNKNPKNIEHDIEIEQLFISFCEKHKHLIKQPYPSKQVETSPVEKSQIPNNQQEVLLEIPVHETSSTTVREQKANHDGLEALRSFFPNGKTAQTYERPTSQNNAGNTQGKTKTAEGVEFDPSKF